MFHRNLYVCLKVTHNLLSLVMSTLRLTVVNVNYLIVPLMPSKEKLKCRKLGVVLQYYQPNPNKGIEKHDDHLLLSFSPFRDEQELKSESFRGSYFEKLQEPDVLEILAKNKASMEPFSELIDQALLNLLDNFRDNDNEADSSVSYNINYILPKEDTAEAAVILEPVSLPNYVSPTLMSDIELNELIRKLNIEQKSAFDKIHGWAESYMQNVDGTTIH